MWPHAYWVYCQKHGHACAIISGACSQCSIEINHCVYLLRWNLLPISFIRQKQVTIWFFQGFWNDSRWKYVIQEFWHHLLVTATFFAPWWAFDGQEIAMASFQLEGYIMFSHRPTRQLAHVLLVVAHRLKGFLAFYACKLLCGTVIQLHITQSHTTCIIIVVTPLTRLSIMHIILIMLVWVFHMQYSVVSPGRILCMYGVPWVEVRYVYKVNKLMAKISTNRYKNDSKLKGYVS